MSRDDDPVEEGQVIHVKPEPNRRGRDPIAWVDGMAVFIPDARVGYETVARVVHVGETFAVAEELSEAEAEEEVEVRA